MLNVVFISGSGDSIAAIERFYWEKSANVHIYIHSPRHRHNGDGIIPKLSPGELKSALDKADRIIFDMTRTNGWAEHLAEKSGKKPGKSALADLELIKNLGLNPKSSSLFGQLAEKYASRVPVIGCDLHAEDIEMDRTAGVELAEKLGFDIPEHHDFKNLKEGADFLKKNNDRLWVFKPHENKDNDLTYVETYEGELLAKFATQLPHRVGDKIEFMLQEAIVGPDCHLLSSEAWWTGSKWLHYNHTIENKPFLTGELGPYIGCQDSVFWIKDEPVGKDSLLFEQFQKYTPYVKKSGYIGPVDFNCVITKDGKKYFLEFTHRFGYDALFCLLALLESSYFGFFCEDFKAEWYDGFSGSQRITIPPFPEEDDEALKKKAYGVPIVGKLQDMPWFWGGDVMMMNGSLACAGADAILGVVTGKGKTLGACVKEVYSNIKKLKVGSYLQYRTDLDVRATKLLNDFRKWGIEVG